MAFLIKYNSEYTWGYGAVITYNRCVGTYDLSMWRFRAKSLRLAKDTNDQSFTTASRESFQVKY